MPPDHDAADGGQILSRVLKALRRRRGLTVAHMASEMGVACRTYEYFEAGELELNVSRVREAAGLLGADGPAILAALEIRSADFALRCADNKLVTILLMALHDFDAEVQDSIALLDPQTLMSSFQRLFRELGGVARQRRALLRRWDRGDAPDSGSE